MGKDVVVVVSIKDTPKVSNSLGILLISTAGDKAAKRYTSLDEIEKDWPKNSLIFKKVSALFNQGKARPTPASLVREVTIIGLKAETPKDLVEKIIKYQDINNDWYLLMTDRADEEYIEALADFAEQSEPSGAELSAGVEDHRKIYFAQTDNLEISIKHRRSIIIYTKDLEEHIDAAWVGTVGPWYPRSVTWKFKMPAGIGVPALTESEVTQLEERNVNFVTNEYKKNYIKNGLCADGEWIDAVLGGDWIAMTMREKLYAVFMDNPNVPYTDAGFTLIASAVLQALDDATGYDIIATGLESAAGIYNIVIPKRADATDEQASSRQMPDIVWEAQLAGAVHGAKISGTLKVNLN